MSVPAVRTSGSASSGGARDRAHDPWLSWARVVAVVAIVAIHVFTHYVTSRGQVSALEWHVANLANAAARFGVPLFVVVSGAALLGRPSGLGPDRTAAHEPVRRFYRRRAVRIGLPLVVWTAFYLWFDRWSTGEPIDVYTFVQGYLWGRPYYHLYFLYVVAGLALVTPFLRLLLANASRRLAWLSALLCLTLAILDKGQHLWMGGGGGFNAFSYFVPWIGYYLLGHCLAREFAARHGVSGQGVTGQGLTEPSIAGQGMAGQGVAGQGRRRHAAVALLVFAAAVVGTAAATWLLFPRMGTGTVSLTYDYFFPLTLVSTVAMAVAVRALAGPLDPAGGVAPRRRPGRGLADLTFGIFLLHPIPLQLWKQYGPGVTFPGQPWLGVGVHVGLLLGLLLVCGAATYAMQRIPLLRRLV